MQHLNPHSICFAAALQNHAIRIPLEVIYFITYDKFLNLNFSFKILSSLRKVSIFLYNHLITDL